MGQMFLEGRHGILTDYQKAFDLFNEAAELAMLDCNGKLADKYYILAEKATSCQS